MLRVDVAVITYGEAGILRTAAMIPAPRRGVAYVVSWQCSEGVAMPPALQRPDVQVWRTPTVGSSANRNNAFAHCTADIVVFTDDDVEFYPSRLDELTEVYHRNPGTVLVTFRSNGGTHYPASETQLKGRLPKGYHAGGIELSVRRKAALQAGLKFCEDMGVNAPRYLAAEDETYLLAAMRRGMECRFVPVRLCSHPHTSTGRQTDPPSGVLRGMGLHIGLAYGPVQGMLRAALKSLRMYRRKQAKPLRTFRHLAQGVAEAPRFRKTHRDSLW